jgi:hypothetical protein
MTTANTTSTLAGAIESLPASSENRPKRVILRLRVNEFEGEGRSWEQYVDAILAYLAWAGRTRSEYEGSYETRKHFAHVEPFQDPELRQTTFHVVLDMEQYMVIDPNFDTLPHEIYRVRRDKKGNLYETVIRPSRVDRLTFCRQVRAFQNPQEAESVICKTRQFTDVLYPWAGNRH